MNTVQNSITENQTLYYRDNKFPIGPLSPEGNDPIGNKDSIRPIPNEPIGLKVSIGKIINDNYLKEIGHIHDLNFRKEIVNRMPFHFKRPIAERYDVIYKNKGRRDANLFLLELDEKFKKYKVKLAGDDEYLCQFAKNHARECHRICKKNINVDTAYKKCKKYLNQFELKPPKLNKETSIAGAILRMSDEYWWRRSIRTYHARLIEGIAIELGVVHSRAGIYVSNETLHRHKQQKQRNRTLLEELLAINELGQEYTLAELADLSVSNPKLRRAELMTRIAGFEIIAKELGLVTEFYTITCPSRMHAILSTSGQQNPKYDGTTPRGGQQHLRNVWSRIRSKLDRKKIKIFGFRVAEPQHDGTPHWHFLLFMKPKQKQITREIFKSYSLQVDGDEPGAEKYRFKPVEIDPKKGTAAGYIAKYISKNIDGYKLDHDGYGNDPVNSALRVEAFARTWGIRQFQQFGGPLVSIWRELRKLDPSSITDDELLVQACLAADAGDWAEFIRVMGGPTSPRISQPIKIQYAWSDKPGKYGEPIGDQIIGLQTNKTEIYTRKHAWTITHVPRKVPELKNYDPELIQNRLLFPAPRAGDSSGIISMGPAPVPELGQNVPGLFPEIAFQWEKLRGFTVPAPLEFCQ